MTRETIIVSGVIVDDHETFTLRQVCEICGVHAEYVMDLVAFGILEPARGTPPAWHFPAPAVDRIKQARRLQHDLHINLPGVSLSLDLLEEVRALRTRVRELERQMARLSESAPVDPG